MDYTNDYKSRNSGGDIADDKCVEYLRKRNVFYIRNGFDQQNEKIPSNKFFKIPNVIRSQPDFIIITSDAYFLEVKGCKEILRLKLDDLKSYDFWDNQMSLYVFVYSTLERSHKIISYAKLSEIAYTCSMDYYEDNNKAYYKIPWERI